MSFTATPPNAAVEGARRWDGMGAADVVAARTPHHTTVTLLEYGRACALEASGDVGDSSDGPAAHHTLTSAPTPEPVAAGVQQRRGAMASTWSKRYDTHGTIGGDGGHGWDVLNANYSADIFAGTNFGCVPNSSKQS